MHLAVKLRQREHGLDRRAARLVQRERIELTAGVAQQLGVSPAPIVREHVSEQRLAVEVVREEQLARERDLVERRRRRMGGGFLLVVRQPAELRPEVRVEALRDDQSDVLELVLELLAL